MTSVNCGGQNRIVPRVPGRSIPTKAQPCEEPSTRRPGHSSIFANSELDSHSTSGQCGASCPKGQHVRTILAGRAFQTPMMAPESSTSMEEAREIFGRPGMSIMLPEITTTNAAPEESEAFCDAERPAGRSAEPLGIIGQGVLRLGDADRQFSIAPFCELLQPRFGLLAEIHIARAVNFSARCAGFFP